MEQHLTIHARLPQALQERNKALEETHQAMEAKLQAMGAVEEEKRQLKCVCGVGLSYACACLYCLPP